MNVLRTLLRSSCIAGAVGFMVLLSGCGGVISTAQPLNPQAFLTRPADAPTEGPVDKTWPPFYNTARPTAAQDTSHNDSSSHPISKTVQDAVVSPDIPATQGATPVAAHAVLPMDGAQTTGVDQVVGSVLGDVDSDPIYADKVIAVLDRALAANAKQYDEAHFRDVAADLIRKQVGEFIHASVEFAAAKRNLESKDEELARQETVRWRQEQITHAGGSVEAAKRRAIDQGTTLDDMCREHYRLIMTQLYYQRRVIPQIQISAGDIRNYYDAHRDKEFSEKATVKFRVIRIDSDKTGGDAAAKEKIEHLRDRFKGGAPFDIVASEVNDDPVLLANKGDPQPGQWMEKGAYVNRAVDDAVWALQPGEVTDVIHSGDSYYLARLEERQGGKVRAFADQEVQDQIYETLRREQFNALREEIRQDLEKKAAIRLNPDGDRVALDMVMQKYPKWAGKQN
jgi:parvulin-like peptidyl-prolyl isomerase